MSNPIDFFDCEIVLGQLPILPLAVERDHKEGPFAMLGCSLNTFVRDFRPSVVDATKQYFEDHNLVAWHQVFMASLATATYEVIQGGEFMIPEHIFTLWPSETDVPLHSLWFAAGMLGLIEDPGIKLLSYNRNQTEETYDFTAVVKNGQHISDTVDLDGPHNIEFIMHNQEEALFGWSMSREGMKYQVFKSPNHYLVDHRPDTNLMVMKIMEDLEKATSEMVEEYTQAFYQPALVSLERIQTEGQPDIFIFHLHAPTVQVEVEPIPDIFVIADDVNIKDFYKCDLDLFDLGLRLGGGTIRFRIPILVPAEA